MSAVNEIEQYIKDQRQAKLLDVAKHIIPAMVPNVWQGIPMSNVVVRAVDVAEALIMEVESR